MFTNLFVYSFLISYSNGPQCCSIIPDYLVWMPPIFSVSAVSILRYYFPITQPVAATAKIFLFFLVKKEVGGNEEKREKENKENRFTFSRTNAR